MIVHTNTGDYDVRFGYSHRATIAGLHRFTRCCIRRPDIEVVVSSEGAMCHAGDQFCKSTGRRIALTRALKAANFTRGERRAVWAEYWKHHRKPR